MIARLWHGEVPAEKTAAYHQYLKESGLKDYKDTPGNKAVFLLKKEKDGITHFYTLTFWEDMNAVKAFAGEEADKARYYPEDSAFLLEFEEKVEHWEVIEGNINEML
jgi:heme-degrading monooxygenase HmoA